MVEKEKIIADATARATEKAKAEKMNSAQTKLFVDEEVKKAVDEFEKNNNTIPTVPIKSNAEKKVTNNTEQSNLKVTEQNIETNKESKYIVHTPVKNFNGEVAGVQFAYGKAEVKPGWVLEWFKEKGYRVEEVSN